MQQPLTLDRAFSFKLTSGPFRGLKIGELTRFPIGRRYLVWAAFNLNGIAGKAAAIAWGTQTPEASE
jgi:hypothetical protein